MALFYAHSRIFMYTRVDNGMLCTQEYKAHYAVLDILITL